MTNVYIIQAEGGLLRVGITINLAARLQSLRSGSPLPLDIVFVMEVDCPQRAAAIERTAHVLLSKTKVRGAWFDVSVEVARKAIQDAAADPHRLSKAGAQRAGRGAVLRSARETHGWSVERMAQQIKVTVDTILAAENGRGYDMTRSLMKAALAECESRHANPTLTLKRTRGAGLPARTSPMPSNLSASPNAR